MREWQWGKKGKGVSLGSRERLVEKALRLREGEITQRLNKAKQCPPFLAWTFVNMRKLEMLGFMRRTLEGEGRMPRAHSLTSEFSSCGAVCFEWGGNALSGPGPRKTMFWADWQWELYPSASKPAAV